MLSLNVKLNWTTYACTLYVYVKHTCVQIHFFDMLIIFPIIEIYLYEICNDTLRLLS